MNNETIETLHLYVVPENELPRKLDYFSWLMAGAASLCILAIIGISVASVTPTGKDVSFRLTVPGFRLAPVSKTLKTTITATGKGHTSATYAAGMITFYNGAIYTQIIPDGTLLKGADGISIITEQQAMIPPAAQTIPPTYSHASVMAQATIAGASGNIKAGDINMACCVTSVIAQNPYAFTGGKNARDFTYLAANDVYKITSALLPTLQTATLSLLPTPPLNPHCSPVIHSSPTVGKEAQSATLTLTETCSADSYNVQSIAHAITTYSTRFGKGMLSNVQFFLVNVAERKGVSITLYVVGRWTPLSAPAFPRVGK
ncbi:MAG TPA: baseplate J/gp47 family protein [Ktedonobacteraceae bacterium]|nr:baseplate J/gp47 family protein [Ktedonobacteraceae bacterium]